MAENLEAGIVWRLAMVEAGREFDLVKELCNLGHDAYVPAETVWVQRSKLDKRRVVGRQALFPGYLFVEIDARRTRQLVEPRRIGEGFRFWAVETRSAVADVEGRPGVIDLVRFGGELAAVPRAAIDELRSAEARCLFDRTAARRLRTSLFEPGQRVRFAAGAWQGLVGVVQRARGAQERVRLLLELLGREVAVETDEAALAPA